MESTYKGHRFPREIISHAVWLYHRFTLSFRDVEDLLAERGITVSYEAIRYWCIKFGPTYARVRSKYSSDDQILGTPRFKSSKQTDCQSVIHS